MASVVSPEQQALQAWEPLEPPELRAAMGPRVLPGQRVPQAPTEQQVLAALQGRMVHLEPQALLEPLVRLVLMVPAALQAQLAQVPLA